MKQKTLANTICTALIYEINNNIDKNRSMLIGCYLVNVGSGMADRYLVN